MTMAFGNLFLYECRTGWRLWGLWAVCLIVFMVFGLIQAATQANFALASAALLPVLAMAWFGGRTPGLIAAGLAAALWLGVDFTMGQHLYAPWVPWANAATRLFVYALVALLAAEFRFQFDRERERVLQDHLTGLRNRRAFIADGQRETQRAQRHGLPLGVIFLDLDHFKQLNETQGHHRGDRALQETAQTLRDTLRATDCIARLSGDEFAILLPDRGWALALETALKLDTALRARLTGFPPVTASLGLAWFCVADRTFPVMLRAAEELLYQAKKTGSGTVRSRRFDPLPPAAPSGGVRSCPQV